MKKTTIAALLTAASFSVAVQPVEVTADNYAQAMFDMGMAVEFNAGGDNTWNHHRAPIALDSQPAPMMNRDTLYSFAIMDAREDIIVNLPEVDGRYMSVQVMNHDHVTTNVFYGAGTYVIKASDTTDFVEVYVRTQMDAADSADIKKANAFQDQFEISHANNYQPESFIATKWDMATFMPVHQHFIGDAQKHGLEGTMGTIQAPVELERKNRGVAIGMGLLPDIDASYKTGEYSVDSSKCYSATYPAPELANEELGFYSITIYDENQYLATDAYSIVTNRDLAYNKDGSFTVHYGNTDSCGEVANLLRVPTDDFSINFRIYLPVLDKVADYTLPEIK